MSQAGRFFMAGRIQPLVNGYKVQPNLFKYFSLHEYSGSVNGSSLLHILVIRFVSLSAIGLACSVGTVSKSGRKIKLQNKQLDS